MWETPDAILEDLIKRYPQLDVCKTQINEAYNMLEEVIQNDGTIFTCGNGGSAADAEHIVGELLKGFMLGRKLPDEEVKKLEAANPGEGGKMAESMQQSIKAISLTSHNSFGTAFLNDVDPHFIFAQQLYGLGRKGDVVIGITTSGNSNNIVNTAKVARSFGIKVIGLTGEGGGKLGEVADVNIGAPSKITPIVQELHLPIYHALCAMVEVRFYSDN